MGNSGLWEWFIDDWDMALRRTMERRFTHRQVLAMRAQWRIGQTAKWSLVVLPVLLLLTYLIPEAMGPLRVLTAFWLAGETFLLVLHVALGVWRGTVSYGWAFHHSHPRLLKGLAARRDLRMKASVATAFAIILFFLLTIQI